MDSIAYTSRLPYAEVLSRNPSRLFKQQQPQRAANLVNKVDTPSRSIFQRALLWIKGWVQGRVKAASINRALAPFIKAAKAGSASAITPEHLNKLASALADGGNPHVARLIAGTVRKSIKSLDLAGLKRLKNLLGRLNQSGTHLEKTLLETVDGNIKEAKVKEAKLNLYSALSIFSEWSAKPVNANSKAGISLDSIKHNLLTIIDLLEPAGKITDVDDAEHLRKIDFRAASSVITKQTLNSWFMEHSPNQQPRVKTNLWSMAQDSVLERSASEGDRAIHAFCTAVTKSLWPNDKRHGLR
nr:hypothetical protein [uncultured Noviherbaspirillum sp.]